MGWGGCECLDVASNFGYAYACHGVLPFFLRHSDRTQCRQISSSMLGLHCILCNFWCDNVALVNRIAEKEIGRSDWCTYFAVVQLNKIKLCKFLLWSFYRVRVSSSIFECWLPERLLSGIHCPISPSLRFRTISHFSLLILGMSTQETHRQRLSSALQLLRLLLLTTLECLVLRPSLQIYKTMYRPSLPSKDSFMTTNFLLDQIFLTEMMLDDNILDISSNLQQFYDVWCCSQTHKIESFIV